MEERTRVRWQTPRPQTPDLLSGAQSSCESFEDYASSIEQHKGMWRPVPTGLKYRSTTISGWTCVPRSVVMATTLNQKHLDHIAKGKLTTLSDLIQKKESRRLDLMRKNRHRLSAKKKESLEPKKPQVTEKDYYERLLDENLTDVNSLSEKLGPHTQERYTIVPSPVSDEEFLPGSNDDKRTLSMKEVKEMKTIENALPTWKKLFIPPPTAGILPETNDYVDELPNTQSPLQTLHSRPLTADSSLQSQCDKASEARSVRPMSASSLSSYRAMKTAKERKKFEKKDPALLQNLPGYPPRVVRSKRRSSTPLTDAKPIMTTTTSWFPISFHSDLLGNCVKLDYDMYGYQSVAEYTELIKTLSDGMAIIEQPMEVGDSIKIKILLTDRRTSLLYVAMANLDENLNSNCETNHEAKYSLPRNRLTSGHDAINPLNKEWEFSYEIPDLKQGDEVLLTRDALGRLKCSVGEKAMVTLQLHDAIPKNIALCLGLGIIKVQLLGCRKACEDLLWPNNAYEIIPYMESENHLRPPYCTYYLPKEECGFCGNVSSKRNSKEIQAEDTIQVPYACDHVKVCPACRYHIECKLCKAPLCWASCPICDTRLQPY